MNCTDEDSDTSTDGYDLKSGKWITANKGKRSKKKDAKNGCMDDQKLYPAPRTERKKAREGIFGIITNPTGEINGQKGSKEQGSMHGKVTEPGETEKEESNGSNYKDSAERKEPALENDKFGNGPRKLCKGGPNKYNCGSPVVDGQLGVECDKCKLWFHASCQGIPKGAVSALGSFVMLSWFCGSCKANVNNTKLSALGNLEAKMKNLEVTMRDHMSSIEETLKGQDTTNCDRMTHLESCLSTQDSTIRKHMRLVECSMKEQETANADQSKLIKRAFQEHSQQKVSYAGIVKESCAKVVEDVSAQMKSLPKETAQYRPQASAIQQFTGAVDQFMDKERRKNNIVIHNLAEEPAVTADDRSRHDIDKLCNMLRRGLNINTRPVKSFRVGKASPDKPRLLIVTLIDTETKYEILRHATRLRATREWYNVFVSPDLTRAEREQGKRLRDELACRRADGETNIKISKGRIVKTTPAVAKEPSQESHGKRERSRPAHSQNVPREGESPAVEVGLVVGQAGLKPSTAASATTGPNQNIGAGPQPTAVDLHPGSTVRPPANPIN